MAVEEEADRGSALPSPPLVSAPGAAATSVVVFESFLAVGAAAVEEDEDGAGEGADTEEDEEQEVGADNGTTRSEPLGPPRVAKPPRGRSRRM
jgi:hypothetical protein